ncbi:MAG: DUF1501 domain-containing protein [Pseudomonadota bacterium]
MIDRRSFLRYSISGLGAAAGFGTSLASFNAFADNAADYKALVCIFHFGGLDCHDSVLPYDIPSYGSFQKVREPLLAAYDSASPRRREQLLRLGQIDDGREFAFPPEYAELAQLYDSGNLAVVGNVGPMIEPLTRSRYMNRSARRPKKLFSHNSQQSTWMTSQPDGAIAGWGGRMSDAINTAQKNSNADFTSVSLDKMYPWSIGLSSTPFVMNRDGPRSPRPRNLTDLSQPEFRTQYFAAIRAAGLDSSNLFDRDLVDGINRSLDNNEVMESYLSLPGDPETEFPAGKLGAELKMIARAIARRNQLGLKRQIFFVAATGYDHHSRQSIGLPARQAEVSKALGAFNASLVELGVQDKVTTFTASEFGRTLVTNGDGTDHGWGGHYFVMGGAVNGGKIYGDIPPPELGHDFDAGRGRLIPTLSVDQYAATLGRWFGLSESDLDDVMPGLENFDRAALTGLFNYAS